MPFAAVAAVALPASVWTRYGILVTLLLSLYANYATEGTFEHSAAARIDIEVEAEGEAEAAARAAVRSTAPLPPRAAILPKRIG